MERLEIFKVNVRTGYAGIFWFYRNSYILFALLLELVKDSLPLSVFDSLRILLSSNNFLDVL